MCILGVFWLKSALIVSILTNLSYWLIIFSKIAKIEQKIDENKLSSPISLIVCIKNGAQFLKNIESYLSSLSTQDELLIINDFSSDDTVHILNEISDPRMRIENAKIDKRGKKMALKQGIESSKHQNILLTDIDCVPKNKSWAALMNHALHGNSSIVLGYSPYKKYDGLFNKFVRHETVITAMQYLSYALIGSPYMGVGRNLAYKKELFLASDRFESHSDLASGDDDLFISQVANKNNVSVMIDPNSFVESDPVKTIDAFLKQKTRHISTANRYPIKIQILLTIYALSHILIYVFAFGLALKGSITFALALLVFRLIVAGYVYSKICKKLLENDLPKWFFILDFLQVIYFVLLSPFLFFKRKEW